ncbi:MAG: hypothetical protein CMO98_04830 [Woeseia sp.]|nr:hypothetical protein [Woeseia sp.]|tara:strand:+ start:823 stop:2397 length:1575 start_codon:yes stop_codon:yes gene_type:complete
MFMKGISSKALVFSLLCCPAGWILAAESPNNIYDKIKNELTSGSMIAENLHQLSNVYGPRLTGTPRYVEMVQWTESTIRKWGVDDVRIEEYGVNDRGWEVESFYAAITSPIFSGLGAQPVCCGASIDGEVSGIPLVVDFYDLAALQKFEGRLSGKILLHPSVTKVADAITGKWSKERLRAAAERTDAVTPDGLDGPGSTTTFVETLRERQNRGVDHDRALAEYLIEQGVAAVLRSSSAPAGLVNNRFDSGLIEFHSVGDPEPVPLFVLAREGHERLLAMLQDGAKPHVSLRLETVFYEAPGFHVNLIADIKGSDPDLKDEVVMLGAHLDSVEMATGAADNGIGAATSMEVLRLIKALKLKPRRTIRVALWGGEEQGLKGSLAYMRRHIGDIINGEYFTEHTRISAYFNHDNNGHDIRGIFTVGHEEIKQLFRPIFAKFADVGADTVTIENAGGTDILVFDASGIPSFEWIHDPGDYFTHQLHTSLDIPSMVNVQSANRNAAIIATTIYETAMMDEMLPRKKVGK